MEKRLEKRFKDLLSIIRDYNATGDFTTLRRAFEFAKLAHAGEKRYSGEEVIWHPLETALILASWRMDLATITAGILHDTIEHGAATAKDVLQGFGEEILALVEGVTKVSKIKLKGSSEELFVENLRKMFLAIAKDLRIVFLRLAERLDNLKTLEYLPEERKVDYARNSLEIYAPLAERLGMAEAKDQIENMAFQYAYIKDYEKVVDLSSPYYKNAERKIILMKKVLLKALNKEGVTAQVYGRKKSLYSLWKKLQRSEISWDFKKINDVVALRILVQEASECYIALGVAHKFYKPVPQIAVNDFIAIPKPNGYRSIHTKVFGPGGNIVEIQIRTFAMHEEAEYGAAAHWRLSSLKSAGKLNSKDIDEGKWAQGSDKFSWVRELAQWQKEIADSKEFLRAVKFDALSERIFVFSPKGDVYDLPVNSTPIDYAYAVHTDLGEYVKAAKVDEKIVPSSYKLTNGRVVEIIKSKNPKLPNKHWLEFVVTTQARQEINKYLRKVNSSLIHQ